MNINSTTLSRIKISETDLFKEATDVHCHFLPGVDDGIHDVTMSQAVLNYYKELGYTRIFLTPHIKEEFPENNADSMRKAFNRYKEELAPEGVELKLAAEYLLDNTFFEYLASGDLLTYNDNHLLVETDFLIPIPDFQQQIEQVRSAGYIPVLAHPERYEYMDFEQYNWLKKNGCLFQINMLSLQGYYGDSIRERGLFLLENDFCDFVGTDAHRYRNVRNGIENFYLTKDMIKKLEPLFEANKTL